MVVVSIIITAYNRMDMLTGCLDTIRYNTEQDYELILVDNGSDKETADYIESQKKMYAVQRIWRFEKNEGFANGFSKGLSLSDRKYRVLLNSDTIPFWGWLSPLVETFKQNPNAGVVMPYTNYACNPEIVCKANGYLDTQTKLIKGDVPAVCWMISKDCYDAVCGIMEKIDGGRQFLHKEFEYGWAEDILTSQIITKLGYEKYVVGGSFIFHHGFATQAILKGEKVPGYRERNMDRLGKYLKRLNYELR